MDFMDFKMMSVLMYYIFVFVCLNSEPEDTVSSRKMLGFSTPRYFGGLKVEILNIFQNNRGKKNVLENLNILYAYISSF